MLELIVKRTKRSVSVVSKQPGATKNESICFSLFTLYFWLLSQRQFKKTAIHKLQKPRPQLLFHRPRFFSFLKTHTPSTLAASADKIQGREKRRDRGDKTKDKNSNICSRFQPDSLMGITQHFVPWPWLTKTHIGGGGCLRNSVGRPGRRVPREHPCSSWNCRGTGRCMPLGLS